jgi:hypothetical protein
MGCDRTNEVRWNCTVFGRLESGVGLIFVRKRIRMSAGNFLRWEYLCCAKCNRGEGASRGGAGEVQGGSEIPSGVRLGLSHIARSQRRRNAYTVHLFHLSFPVWLVTVGVLMRLR